MRFVYLAITALFLVTACKEGRSVEESASKNHDEIQQVFDNVFFVMAENVIDYAGFSEQSSRNMVIVREGRNLSLINTVKLSEKGLSELEKLGEIKEVIRIGAFHGRDDAFYVNRYSAGYWSIPGIVDEHGLETGKALTGGEKPFSDFQLINFETSKFPEAAILVKRDGGILITCDSIKNWLKADRFFDRATAKAYIEKNYFGQASLSSIWLQATAVKADDFKAILALPFNHVLSAHGEPLKNRAKEAIQKSYEAAFVN